SRYYDTLTCRFISMDLPEIATLDQGNLLQHNLFSYCLNDPVNYADPEGEFALSALLIGMAIGVAAGLGIEVASDVIDDGEINNDVKAYIGSAVFGLVSGMAAGFGGGVLISGIFASAGQISSDLITEGSVNMADTVLTFITSALSAGIANKISGVFANNKYLSLRTFSKSNSKVNALLKNTKDLACFKIGKNAVSDFTETIMKRKTMIFSNSIMSNSINFLPSILRR
ncbi:MAG: hypothetical protein PHT83_05900, partial [Bacilli bacterium]|nr:hypothetical protein [Bacilli bacterium]